MPGVHSDVGGGYQDDFIANVALLTMCHLMETYAEIAIEGKAHRLGRVLINAQIAAPLWLSKKRHSPLLWIRRIVQTRGHSCAGHGQAAVWVRANFCRIAFRRRRSSAQKRAGGMGLSHKIDLGCRHIRSGAQ
jgi:hypothetical protein